MDASPNLINNFMELYKTEIKSFLEKKDYVHAYLLLVDSATAMREDMQNMTPKFPYAIVLSATAYGLVQDLEKYVRNPTPKMEKEIGIGKSLLEMAIKKSELSEIQNS